MMRLKLFTTIAAYFQSVYLKEKNKPFADRKRLVFFCEGGVDLRCKIPTNFS